MADFGQTAATEALAGLVERVTFHNPENGFCVLRIKARGQRDLITVVGHAAMISAGEFVQMSILDPFAGTGSTGVAARNKNFDCVLIEQDATMRPVIEDRVRR